METHGWGLFTQTDMYCYVSKLFKTELSNLNTYSNSRFHWVVDDISRLLKMKKSLILLQL